ncbi:MAG: hypothetical protein NZ989_05325 [Bacteroidia bacterium]|nr:hypothetical protein [Bacteroidia bacterium]MDW8057672.1 hypothetical protein [Bacteroidia bacterium]
MLRMPAPSVLESYAKELQRTWLTGKVFPTWTLQTLRENIFSEQVIQFILFQVESRALSALYEAGFWDWKDGELIGWADEFFTRAQSKLSIGHIQLSSLLHAAIYHSLRVLLDPKEGWAQFYFGQRNALLLQEFRFYSRYVVYFDFIPEALLSYAQRNSLTVIDKALWTDKVERILSVYEEETQEKIAEYQRRQLEKMCQQPLEVIQKRWETLAQEGENLISSVFSESSSSSQDLMKNLFGTDPGARRNVEEGARARNPLLSAIDYEPRRVLMEQFQTPIRRAETLRRFEPDQIPVHKQFVYIQRVFDGDPIAFRHALERLNDAASAEEARALLRQWRTEKADQQALAEFEQWVLSRFQN